MSPLALTLAYLRQRPLTTALNVLLLALGVATIVVLLLFGRQVEGGLSRGAEGIDAVVGAKGSPLQLILSSVYHLDAPTGNIPLAEAESLAANPMVARTIPLALGDAYRGFRIVGTEASYVEHYGGRVAEGALWEAPREAVVGARVARETGLGVGDALVSAHGLSDEGYGHDEAPLRVVGVLAPGASVLDGLVLTSVETVWDVHGLGTGAEAPGGEHDSMGVMPPPPAAGMPPMPGMGPGAPMPPGGGRDLTALLVTYSSPLAVAFFPRFVNTQTNLQAAQPAAELQRLLRLLGLGFTTLRLFGGVLVLAAMLGVFVALLSAMQERRYDLAVMRTLGARPLRLAGQVLLEGTLLAAMGTALGLVLGHGATELLGRLVGGDGTALDLTGLAWAPAEALLVVGALGIGLVAALIPAVQAYRADVAPTLARG